MLRLQIHDNGVQRGSTVLIPSCMVDSFNVPGVIGLTSAVGPAAAAG